MRASIIASAYEVTCAGEGAEVTGIVTFAVNSG